MLSAVFTEVVSIVYNSLQNTFRGRAEYSHPPIPSVSKKRYQTLFVSWPSPSSHSRISAGESALLLALPPSSKVCWGDSRGDCSFCLSRDLLDRGVTGPDSSAGSGWVSASSYWGGNSCESCDFEVFEWSCAI